MVRRFVLRMFVVLRLFLCRALLRHGVAPCQFRRASFLFLANNDSNNGERESNKDENSKQSIPSPTSSSNAISQAQLLKGQLEALRQEIQQDVQHLQQYKESRHKKKQDKVDRWIDDLLVAVRVDEDTQMLHSVEIVAQKLMDGRFSPEQVNAIFERMTQEDPQSRVESPLIELLVDACNRVDCLEQEENPNKRWKGRVEMILRRKMFAMKWGIALEEDKETNLYD